MSQDLFWQLGNNTILAAYVWISGSYEWNGLGFPRVL